MGDQKTADKFELVVQDKTQVVQMVNELGAEAAKSKNQSTFSKAMDSAAGLVSGRMNTQNELRGQFESFHLDTHDGRKEFLKKLGVDAATSDDFRLVTYTNAAGQTTLFKGHTDWGNKLVLTDSLPLPETIERIPQLLQSSFKPLEKPIEVQLEKTTPGKDGAKVEVSSEQRKKLELEASLASAIQKSADAPQLASHDAEHPTVPSPGAGKMRTTGVGSPT